MSTPYHAFDFVVTPVEPFSEILIAELASLGFESFEETPQGIKAYIPFNQIDLISIDALSVMNHPEVNIQYSLIKIPPKNWNAEWEKDFVPVIVDKRCRIRASFHSAENFPLEIVIDPKMSFGTGHHETTHLMLSHIMYHDFKKKAVLDMGCGTGVLGIAALLLGANSLVAVDVEPWCISNTLENGRLNGCPQITPLQSERVPTDLGTFDWVFANINRNVLLEQMAAYGQVLKQGGKALLSGFYQKDRPIISEQMTTLGMETIRVKERNDWVAILFQKNH